MCGEDLEQRRPDNHLINTGEALIDMLPRETKAGEQGFAPYAGGSVFNTASWASSAF